MNLDLQWTTPADIRSAFELLGIRDVLDIKTFEYRCNGQSKGYCLVILGSLESMQLAKAQLYKTEIHGNMVFKRNRYLDRKCCLLLDQKLNTKTFDCILACDQTGH